MFNIMPYIWIIALLGALFFGFDYLTLKNKYAHVSDQLSAANATIEKLDKKKQAEKQIQEHKETILKEIRDAPPQDDGPIAPVLRRTVERLHTP